MNRRKTTFVLLLIFSLIVVIFFSFKLLKIRKKTKFVNKKNLTEKKTILFYTRYDEKNPRWGKIPETYVMKGTKSEDCPYTNCVFTHNHSYLKNIEEFDAIIFQRNVNHFWVPPSKRRQGQLYIMKNHEL